MSSEWDALAARLEAISRQLRTHSSDLAEVRQLADTTHRVLDDLVERLDETTTLATETAAALAEHLDGPDEAVRCWSWLAAPDPEALDALAQWVATVLVGYPDTLRTLSGCWPWHPWAVEELLALHRAWTETYHGRRPPGAKAVDWHDRYKPGVLGRLKTLEECAMDAHTPGGKADHTRRPMAAGIDQAKPAGAWWTDLVGVAP